MTVKRQDSLEELPIEFRFAIASDLDAIYKLNHALFKSSYAYTKALIEALISKENVYIATTFDDLGNSELIGYIMLNMIPSELTPNKEVSTVMSLGVTPIMRCQGIGSRLMTDIFESNKMITWYLHVRKTNTTALHLYESLGFKVAKELKNYYDDVTPPDDAYYMVRERRMKLPFFG